VTRWIALLFALLFASPAWAQCRGAGLPFNCVQGGVPQPADLVMGGNAAGRNSVFWTLNQVLGAGTTPAAFPSITVNSVTINGFGTAIGDGLGPLINYQGSGLPGLLLSSRLILSRQTAAFGDGIDVQVQRNATFAGGTQSNINKALFVSTSAGAGNGTQEWAALEQVLSNGTAGGLGVASYHQGIKEAASTDPVWATISDAKDLNVLPSSASGGQLIGHELDMTFYRADDQVNPTMFGGVGNRVGLNIIGFRGSASDAVQAVISKGIWFTTGLASNRTPAADTLTNFASAIGFGINTQIGAALDTRGAIAPANLSNPVSAVVMSAGHIIDFDGGASVTSPPGRSMVYNAGLTRWQYLNGVNELLSMTDNGAFTVGGSFGNAIKLQAASTGIAPQFVVFGGTDPSIDFVITPKGAGLLNINGTAVTTAVSPSSFSATRLYQIKVGGTAIWIAGSPNPW
jgi:hypothetical protein